MFCPRCGAENDSGRAFCRRCGLPLRAVRLAAGGRVDGALAGINKGSGNVSGGALIIVIGLLNALINGYFAAWQSALVSALTGAGVGAPLIAAGMLRVRRAKRLLNPDEEPEALEGTAPHDSLPEATARESVAEQTTLKLDAPRAKTTNKVNRR